MSIFVAIDVETADPWPGSICQIGLVGFTGGQLRRRSWLVDPARPFDPKFTKIHGLNAARVRGAAPFGAVLPEVLAEIGASPVMSYGPFDARAIGSACAAAGLPFPALVWLDGLEAARAAWPEAPSRKLRDLGAGFGIRFKADHDAEQDAIAAAYVFLRALKDLGLSAAEAAPHFAIRDIRVIPPTPPRAVPPIGAGWGAVLARSAGVPPSLQGQVVVFTGDLPFSREEMAERVAALGGVVKPGVTTRTTLIVSGWPRPEDGGQKLKSAADRIMDGQAILYCTHDQFLTLVE
ncbi:MAG: hypothetical protein LCH38_10955 [Proteobacteria bacterium]|nr:hypothetical protein [Pseudomonadota bacterium]